MSLLFGSKTDYTLVGNIILQIPIYFNVVVQHNYCNSKRVMKEHYNKQSTDKLVKNFICLGFINII